ncbi:porin family protein [Emcibacter sp.]|uniref:porin family protein n=1 Tax=Emcibacter sp. TaxID=1979954 RepID=UPI003A8CAF30
MKKTILAVASAALLLGSASAHAQENQRFTGTYAGVEVGYNDLSWDVEGIDIGANGLAYGLFAGYRQQMASSLVLGLEARVGESTASLGEEGASIDAGRQLGLDATIGTTLGAEGNILGFAFVGYENARLTAHLGNEEESSDLDGIRFGVGAEYAFSENLGMRATVAYTDYEADMTNLQILTGLVYNF